MGITGGKQGNMQMQIAYFDQRDTKIDKKYFTTH
jgi:hypothetical protein